MIAILIGLIVQVMTKNSVLSMLTTAVLVLATTVLYFANSTLFAGRITDLLSSLALFDRLQSFINGIFDVTALVYYLTVIALFVYLTVQSLEKKRWS